MGEEMILYEIVNPSDPYTIECADYEIAAVACILLGNGAYAFKPLKEEDPAVPLFLTGAAAWFKEKFGASTREVVERIIETRTSDLADALDSVVVGNRRDFFRKAPDDPVEFADFRARWHDRRRSSMNDIGGKAYELAATLRELAPNAG